MEQTLEKEVEIIYDISNKKVSKEKIRTQLEELIKNGRNGDSQQSYSGIKRDAIKYLNDYYKEGK